jgi:protein SCO1/2
MRALVSGLLRLAVVALVSTSLHAAERTVVAVSDAREAAESDGGRIDLDVYRGRKVLVTMFYGSCPATCPLIIDTLRAVERKLGPKETAQLRVLMVSIDPERDSPEALRELATTRRIDTARWALAHADAACRTAHRRGIEHPVPQVAGRQFSHSTVISALDADGKILVQSAVLGHADPSCWQR